MNQLALNDWSQNRNLNCSELLRMAQRELAAFFGAVMNLFGAEQAQLSAEDWLQELHATTSLPASTREWRHITIRAATRLAERFSPATATITSLAQASY